MAGKLTSDQRRAVVERVFPTIAVMREDIKIMHLLEYGVFVEAALAGDPTPFSVEERAAVIEAAGAYLGEGAP